MKQSSSLSFSLTLAITAIAMVAGITLGWLFKSTTAPDDVIQSESGSSMSMFMPAPNFADNFFEQFPEAYQEYTYFSFVRDEKGVAYPAEIRAWVPSRRFGEEFRKTAGLLDNVGAGYSVDERTITRELMPERLDDLAVSVFPEGTARCPDFYVGPVRDIRNPNWNDTKVRELKIELNLGC